MRKKPLFGIPEFEGMPDQQAKRVWNRCWVRSLRHGRTWLGIAITAFCTGTCAYAGSLIPRQFGLSLELEFWISMLCACIGAAIGGWVGARIESPLMRVLVRRELGLACRVCDYDLKGNVSGVCPECGTPIQASRSDDEGKASGS